MKTQIIFDRLSRGFGGGFFNMVMNIQVHATSCNVKDQGTGGTDG
jgi:hypothetical protein